MTRGTDGKKDEKGVAARVAGKKKKRSKVSRPEGASLDYKVPAKGCRKGKTERWMG